jgi:hypothetical protein
LFNEQVSFLLVGGRKGLELGVALPTCNKFNLIVGVLAQVHIDFHDVFEILGDDGHSDVVLVVDDDAQYLCRKYLALHQDYYIGLVELQLLLYLTVHVIFVFLVVEVGVLSILLVTLLCLFQDLSSVLNIELHQFEQVRYHAFHFLYFRPES